MKDFLLEIGVEPLPARFIPGALHQLKRNAEHALQHSRLAARSVRTLGTYRRLALVIEGLVEKSEPLTQEALGPKLAAATDAEGKWTQAALGFAKSQGVAPEDLKIVDSPKGQVVSAKKTLPGEAAEKILLRLIPELIGSLEFPKTMVWNETKTRFGRPIRGLLALWGTKPLNVRVAGIKSSRAVIGLSALGSKPVKIASPLKYEAALKNACILVDPAERRASLEKVLDTAVKKLDLKVDKDPALLEETVYLTEHPVAVHGQFDERFLKVPPELISLAMKKQLKFFPVLDKRGKVSQHFVGIRDGISEGQKEVQEGFERVLVARLTDALFFFEKDLKTTLEDKRARLKDVAFLHGFGSVLDRSERTSRLAALIAHDLNAMGIPCDEETARKAGALAYADLTSEVVREFPELQATIGGTYAEAAGDAKLGAALRGFYRPAGATDALPDTLEGCVTALAGKLDTLVANFAAGNIPSGSEDPFALRRQAAGAVRIILDKRLPLDLGSLIERAIEKLATQQTAQPLDAAALRRNLEPFIWQRAEASFAEAGFPVDEVRSVADGALANLPETRRRLEALHRIRKDADFGSLATSYKRIANILRQAKDAGAGSLDETLMQVEEKDLLAAVVQVRSATQDKLKASEYDAYLKELVRLKEPLDRFFDKVMVMAEDPRLKANRLALLSQLKGLFIPVADLSKLQ